MDLNNVSRTALLEIDKGVTRKEIKEIIILQISLSGIRLITYSRNSTTNLISKLSELIIILNLKRSPKKVLRLLRKGSRRTIKKVCKTNIRLSIRFLRPI